MARRDNISPNKVRQSQNRKDGGLIKNGFLRFIVMNPGVALVGGLTILVLGIAIIVFLLYNANVQMDQILEQYVNLSAKANDSKRSFKKKLFYVTVDDQGRTIITISLNTGVDEEEESSEEGPDGENGPAWDENPDNKDPEPPELPTDEPKTVDERIDWIHAFLRNKGYNEYAVAGIMGNIWIETGGTFDPEVTSGSGYYGLCQWDKTVRTPKLKSLYPSTYNLVSGQCEYIIWETQNNMGPGTTKCTPANMNDPITFFSGKDSTVKSDSDKVRVNTYLFAKYFEGCITSDTNRTYANASNAYQHFDQRASKAQEIYDRFN